MTIAGKGSGVVIYDAPTYDTYKIGDQFIVDGESYTITGKECLSKVADGVYDGKPIFLLLRGFSV